MRLAELTEEQVDDISILRAVLGAAGWTMSASVLDAGGRWLETELTMRLDGHQLDYRAGNRSVDLALRPEAPSAQAAADGPVGYADLTASGPVRQVAAATASAADSLGRPDAFARQVLAASDVTLYARKGRGLGYQVSEAETRRLVEPRWEDISFEELDFYLAVVLADAVHISRGDSELAHVRLLAQAETNPAGWLSSAEARGSHTLCELFSNDRFVDCELDDQGAIVGLRQGGDDWVLEHLDAIADLVRPGSFFLLQDDATRFWRVDYHGRARYRGESVEHLELP